MKLFSKVEGYEPAEFDINDYEIYQQCQLASNTAQEQLREAHETAQKAFLRIIDTICQQLGAYKDIPIYVQFNESQYHDKDNLRKLIPFTIVTLQSLSEFSRSDVFVLINHLENCVNAYKKNGLGYQPTLETEQKFQPVVEAARKFAPTLEAIFNPHIAEINAFQKKIEDLVEKNKAAYVQLEDSKPKRKLFRRIQEARTAAIQTILERATKRNDQLDKSHPQKSIHRSLVTVSSIILKDEPIWGNPSENIFDRTIKDYKPLSDYFTSTAASTDFVKSQLLQLRVIVNAYDKDYAKINEYEEDQLTQELLASFKKKAEQRHIKEEQRKTQAKTSKQRPRDTEEGEAAKQRELKEQQRRDAAEKLAKECAKLDIHKFNEFLESLKATTDKLINSRDKSYKTVKQPARDLYQGLERIRNEFQADKSDMTPEIFKQKCSAVVKAAKDKFQQHRGLWFKHFHPIVRAILGVLATITIVPALIVAVASKPGYKNTFFATPKTRSLKALEEFSGQLEEVDKPRLAR